jgi:hypothetical protein
MAVALLYRYQNRVDWPRQLLQEMNAGGATILPPCGFETGHFE